MILAWTEVVAGMNNPRPGTSHAGAALMREAAERDLAGRLDPCPQLRNRPGLPRVWLGAHPGSMFCPGCAMRAQRVIGGTPEDNRCDACGAEGCRPMYPMSGLTPTGLIVMAGLCKTCRGAAT